MQTSASSPRLLSLDALRGFDMFWIIGGDAVVETGTKLLNNTPVTDVGLQFSAHVEWAGFRYYDMIFPLFLFIIGVTLPFSLERRMERGEKTGDLIRHIVGRTLILILLGLITNGLFRFDGWDHLRLFGVLQRQAFGYCGASLFLLFTKPRTQAFAVGAILLGYWAVLALTHVPGFPPGTMSPEGNFANYVDRLMLLPHQMYESYGDPEGIVSNIPAVATCLLGVFAGRWLKRPETESADNPKGLTPARKALGLAAAGAVLILLGLAWAPYFPVIKKIWTSSYVLVAGGSSMELLALFYWLIDVRGWTKWAFPFVVIGMNPILIYMLSEVVDFGHTAGFFLDGVSKYSPDAKDLMISAGSLLIKWLLLYFLYRQRVFVKV